MTSIGLEHLGQARPSSRLPDSKPFTGRTLSFFQNASAYTFGPHIIELNCDLSIVISFAPRAKIPGTSQLLHLQLNRINFAIFIAFVLNDYQSSQDGSSHPRRKRSSSATPGLARHSGRSASLPKPDLETFSATKQERQAASLRQL